MSSRAAACVWVRVSPLTDEPSERGICGLIVPLTVHEKGTSSLLSEENFVRNTSVFGKFWEYGGIYARIPLSPRGAHSHLKPLSKLNETAEIKGPFQETT